MLAGIVSRVRVQRPERMLRVVEITPLGEKRFVAVVSYGDQQFLLGGASTSVSLLANLPACKRSKHQLGTRSQKKAAQS